MSTETRNLATSERTIRDLQNQVLQLKLRNRQLEQYGRNSQQTDLDETKRDFVASLLETNNKLQEKIQELEEKETEAKEVRNSHKRETKDAECQTSLDSYNMDELFEAKIQLKRQLQSHAEQLAHNQAQKRPCPTTTNPIVDMRPPTSTRHMLGDEKVILEKLMTINGSLTKTRDMMRAKCGC